MSRYDDDIKQFFPIFIVFDATNDDLKCYLWNLYDKIFEKFFVIFPFMCINVKCHF